MKDTNNVETRERIVTTAARLVSQRGRRHVRVVDVAKSSHVAAPTIYYYFGSFERLMSEAQELVYQQLSAPLKASLAQAESALERGDEESFWDVIGSHLESAWRSGQQGRESSVAKVLTGVLASDETTAKFEQMIDETYARWSQMMQQGQRLGWVREDADVEALIAIFWSSSVGQAFLGGDRMRALHAPRVRETFLAMSRAKKAVTD
ncbi:MAG: TetR/AcrR family transcriptional regulator [Acidobacteriota bacterium]|nr:TetR/AcrR family transcriptional regulator [Acidobacteriota bacterium]MDE3044387.1 TetR/AcrR family transcriptional regulator [Acidobacteriota bacterium]MDE3107594.1 TetR/AcrR family transcriptional regulator [Acidobacteriota bacterium]